MLEPERRDPRAPGDRRMYLYFNYSESGSLRWYVKVSHKGRRIGIREEYGTPAFDAAYEAGVAALGGVMRVRRVKATVKPDQPERRYLYVDVSQRGQVRYYVQLRNKLPKIRIKAEFGTPEFEAEVDAAIATQIALYGNEGDYINAQKQRNEARPALPTTTPQPGTLRWYWNGYKQSDHWPGDLSVGQEGLSDSTRLQRSGLIESLLPENGEKPFAVLTRKVIQAEMKARTPSQAGNLLSALRGMIRWMIGAGVFTGKLVKDRVLPMNKKAWAAKFKKYTVLAGVNEPKKSCHGVRKARAEVAAYADCTESQMMAMFGWTDPKMPAHYIAKANREKLGMSGMDKIVAFDQSQSLDDFMPAPKTNRVRTSGGNGVVTFPGNFGKKA